MKTNNKIYDFHDFTRKNPINMDVVTAALEALDKDPHGYTDLTAGYVSDIFDLVGHSLSTPGFQAVTACDDEAGIITDINQLMASVYKAPFARFSSGGSSLAILCLLAAVLPKISGRRKIVLVDSHAHQSVTGGLIFGGWQVVRIPRPYCAKYGIHGPIQAEDISGLIEKFGADNVAAVFYTAPGYNGFRNCADERDIYQLCNDKGIFVITDSAWGSTYGLAKNDHHSLIDNADIVITSPHKRGLTPNSIAVILFRQSYHADIFSHAGRLGFSSTSPSYILLAVAQYRFSHIRAGRLETSFEHIKALSHQLENRASEIHPHICAVSCADINVDYHDPAHLLLSTAGVKGVDARQWASVLSTHYHLDVEKASQNTLLLLLSPQHYQHADQIITLLRDALIFLLDYI